MLERDAVIPGNSDTMAVHCIVHQESVRKILPSLSTCDDCRYQGCEVHPVQRFESQAVRELSLRIHC